MQNLDKIVLGDEVSNFKTILSALSLPELKIERRERERESLTKREWLNSGLNVMYALFKMLII